MAVIIHEDDIRNGLKFVPLEQKELMTRLIASLCIEKNETAGEVETVPPMYHENRMRRQQFLMGILAYYLKRDYELAELTITGTDGKPEKKAVNFCMSIDSYNEWAGAHVMNQLERLKRSKNEDVRNGVYDLLYDFHNMENMLLGAIRDNLESANDLVKRFINLAQISVTPDVLKQLMEEASNAEKGAAANG